MPRVLFTHAVTDVDTWASKHAERAEAFSSWGTQVVDYLSADGSKNVAVGVDVHDMDAMQAALESPEMDAKKREHGVIEPVALLIEND